MLDAIYAVVLVVVGLALIGYAGHAVYALDQGER